MAYRKWALASALALALHIPLAVAQQAPYELGLGYKAHEKITIGGYFSTEFTVGEDTRELLIEDVAILAYGSLTENLSFLAELESVDFYKIDFENQWDRGNTTPAIERLYADYKVSDYATFRMGKQITPIGYWNLQPINVLRETTSNPRLSREMFPKFLTGLAVQASVHDRVARLLTSFQPGTALPSSIRPCANCCKSLMNASTIGIWSR